MKKKHFLSIAVLVCLALNLQAQNWQSMWNATATQKDTYTSFKLLACDHQNNVFVETNYLDSIFIGDTVFGHNTISFASANEAVAKFDSRGNFLFALDLVTDTTNEFSYPVFSQVASDKANNLYLVCTYFNWVIIQDSVILRGEGSGNNYAFRDVAIIKLNPDLEIEFVKLISGSTDDRCRGIYVGDDGFLYLNCTHAPLAYQTDTVNFFGQDSLIVSRTTTSLLKMNSSTGDLVWRQFASSNRHLNYPENEFLSLGNNRFAIYGWLRDTLFVQNDTIVDPYNPGPDYSGHTFVITIDSTGQIEPPEILP